MVFADHESCASNVNLKNLKRLKRDNCCNWDFVYCLSSIRECSQNFQVGLIYDTIRYDTIDDLRWKTDRQAASLI